jgi:hypothetical protein
MNWRRGLLLAGIQLAVAIPLMLTLEFREEHELRAREDRARETTNPPHYTPPEFISQGKGDEGQTVTFGPCDWMGHPSTQELVVGIINLPIIDWTGWHENCPEKWTLAGRVDPGKFGWASQPSIARQKKVDAGMAVMIAALWFFVGAFPLRRPKRWWTEPGAFITACAVVALPFALPYSGLVLARLPASAALFAWLWWFGLLVWKSCRAAWLLARRTFAPTS